jgi:hypothetical protein
MSPCYNSRREKLNRAVTLMGDHDFTPKHASILRSSTRAVAHMHQQILSQRLCLIFGAGAGYDLGFPQWRQLLERLGENLTGFSEARPTADSETSLAQLLIKLFEYEFNSKNAEPPLDDAEGQRSHRARLNAEWRNRIHLALYRDVITGQSEEQQQKFFTQRCYYSSFLEVIKRSSVTVTYNFDDSIERFLGASRSAAEKTKKRGYTSIYDENSQLPSLAPVIYHPNGFLAHLKAEKPSAQLILSEESFAEQLTDYIAGRQAVLHAQLSQKTCLLIGCSLMDPTLNYLLKRNATHHPGHYHYYAHWTGRDGEMGPCPPAYVDRLFELYNLVTLSLSTEEIMALGDLLSYPHDFLLEAARDNNIDPMFTYIVTGAVGSGKSSVISHFRSLKQHDEWLEPRKPGMEKKVDTLTDDEMKAIDGWVDGQFALKNRSLYSNDNAIGIHILDRGPLDPLAFTREGQIPRRARRLRSAICRKSKLQKEIVPAHVILLSADPSEMEIRATSAGKLFDADTLEKQERLLRDSYGEGAGVTVIDTRGLSVQDVVKRVASVIHNQSPYQEVNLTDRIEQLQQPAQGQFDYGDP